MMEYVKRPMRKHQRSFLTIEIGWTHLGKVTFHCIHNIVHVTAIVQYIMVDSFE